MHCKKVIINVFCPVKPYYLTVVVDNCIVINNYKTSTFQSQFCICTQTDTIKIIAKYNNQSVYKNMFINNNNCQNVFVNFAFNNIVSAILSNFITLLDMNYGLPVANAILDFVSP